LNEKNPVLSTSPSDFSYLSDGCSSVISACTIDERLRLRQYTPSMGREGVGRYTYVPGTLKVHGNCWYYVPSTFQKEYLELFKEILTAKRSGSAPPPLSGPVQAIID
jgi:hypothetical protein